MIKFQCECEMGEHSAPVETYAIDSGALSKLPAFTERYSRICIVCDETTYAVAGKNAEETINACGKLFSLIILPKDPLPNYETVGNILVHITAPTYDSDIFKTCPLPDFILAVGSGTINDSCRLVAYRLGIPYGVISTAPSMDGYLSAGSPFLFDGSKATIKATTPVFLIADTDIMKDAPWDMLLAGIGDMFGKYTGILDWELARDYKNEYFCEKIAADVINATNSCLDNGYLLKSRDTECIKNVMNGFAVTGLGMAYTGNSRPASGSEHIIAHAWELEDVAAGRKPNLHGLEVCEATRLVAEMYILLLNETYDEHLKKLISKYTHYFDKIEKFCADMKMPSPIKEHGRLVQNVMKALKMRDRYTILYYLDERNSLLKYAEAAATNLLRRI